MIIYPAIDLRNGKVVRLKEGNPDRQTIFNDNPVETAQQWIAEGATWIHMVNLDGAFQETNSNLKILEQAAKLNAKIQFGGGLRSLESIRTTLDAGASRVVLGTVAVENPELVDETISQFGAEAISIALDSRNGKITTHGWQTKTTLTPTEFGKIMAEKGAIHALFTDVQRDGRLTGSNVEDTIALGKETGLKVIASGGVTTVQEIRKLSQSGFVAGAIIGMALYQGKLSLGDALSAAKESNNAS